MMDYRTSKLKSGIGNRPWGIYIFSRMAEMDGIMELIATDFESNQQVKWISTIYL